MDVRFVDAAPSAAEREAVDAVLGSPPTGWEGGRRSADETRVAQGGAAVARAGRHQLLPCLHALNDRVGWISRGGLDYLCRRLLVPPAEAYGVASFYGLFSLEPRPPRVLHICDDLACQLAGPPELPASDEATAVVPSPCLGLCERAPAVLAITAGSPPVHDVLAPATVLMLAGAAAGLHPPGVSDVADAVPQAGDPVLVLLRRIGTVDPTSLAAYRAAGGFEALRRAFDLGPAGVLRELEDSRLLGRGGAAFPAGRKWAAVARQPDRPHELVANADESEPGTFKDRVLMEGDPFAVVEAMTIAGITVGAERGFLYLRGEYPVARARLEHAIAQCRSHGLLGDDVMGRGAHFDITVFRGAGAYICGEETAIFNSIEGARGEPRNKPPFPVDAGLFGRPTLVNNIETLVNVLPIVLGGGPAFATVGSEGSTGTKLFCLSGHVERPGVYEVPFGTTLRSLLELAGGVTAGRPLQAVLLGGAAGGFVGPDDLDVPLTFEGTRAIGASLGSGVVMVLDDTADLVPFLLRIAAFFRDESCGQCVPCRVGTVRQEEALHRLASSSGRAGDLALLADVAQVMQDASICGLGQTAANAVASAISRLGAFGGVR
jgi:NADH-quinone oxidoreductase subunit F